jgi:outer membrane immunogenic protein
MKKVLPIATAGFLAFGTVMASAADMTPPVVAKAPPPLPSVYYPWTGFYIGGNIGSGLANTDFSGTSNGTFGGVPFQESFSASRSQHGWLGGGQIGINYEFVPRWVLGVEADIDWSHINGSVSSCSTKTAAGVIDCSTSSGKIDDFGTVRGRLGYAFDNLLLYGTGGFAWANETVTDTETCNGTKCPKTSNVFAINSASSSATPDGWAAGGGLEWRFLPNWTLRVEYLHLQFNGISNTFNLNGTVIAKGVPVSVVSTSTSSANTGVEVIRVGLNYVFNWGPESLARY